jgi:hypothetical protein
VTDGTHDRDRPPGEVGDSTETTHSEGRRRTHRFGGADRTPAGTAESTRSTADRPTGGDRDGISPEDANAEPNGDRVEERLRAVERALTGTDGAVADLDDAANASAEREELEARLDDLEARVEELEAATQAIRGYVGSIRSVNQAVERRADLALARASECGEAGADDERTANDCAATADGPHHDEEPRDGETTNEAVRGDDAAAADSLDTGVPSESALDDAVPTDRGQGTGTAAEPAADRRETDREHADDSWGSGALDRLRDSL